MQSRRIAAAAAAAAVIGHYQSAIGIYSYISIPVAESQLPMHFTFGYHMQTHTSLTSLTSLTHLISILNESLEAILIRSAFECG